jgi:hypothetical protein
LGLPDIGPADYLLDAMNIIGPIRANMNGVSATDWDVIDPFARATGLVQEPWEMITLHEMCSAYASGLHEGKDPLSIAPAEREQYVELRRTGPSGGNE